MNTDDYLDAIHDLDVETGRGHDIANFLVGFTASWLTDNDRARALEAARKIYGKGDDQ